MIRKKKKSKGNLRVYSNNFEENLSERITIYSFLFDVNTMLNLLTMNHICPFAKSKKLHCLFRLFIDRLEHVGFKDI